MWQFHPLFSFNLVTAGLAALIAAVAWRRRTTPGATGLAALMTGVVLWSLASAVSLIRADLAGQLFWANMAYLGIGLVPASWLLFALQYAAHPLAPSRRLIAALAVEPLLVLLLAWTNDVHGLFRTSVELVQRGDYMLLVVELGPAFWAHTAYAYLLLVLGSVVLLRSIGRTRGLYRHQAATLLVGVSAPWIANALYLSGRSPLPDLDLTPMGFAISGAALAWNLWRLQLLDVVPVARHKLVEQLGDGVVVLDARRRVVDLNAAAREMLGPAGASSLGRPAAEVFAAWPLLAAQLPESADPGANEVTLEGPVGTEVFDVRVSRLRDRAGEGAGTLIVWRDITARIQAEERLRALAEERIRLLELAELARDAAESASKARSRFLASMSHELRTPLHAILGYTQLLDADSGDAQFRRDAIRQIGQSGGHLLELITDLLDLARLEAGAASLRETPVQLATLLGAVAAEIADQARRKGLRFTFALEPADGSTALPAALSVDSRRLRQVLLHLLGNAVKLSTVGEVVFTVAYEPPGPGGERWRLHFQVDAPGVGALAARLPQLAAPDGQSDTPSHADSIELGLAICLELLRLMGSELQLGGARVRTDSCWFTLALNEADAERLPLAVDEVATLVATAAAEPVAPEPPAWPTAAELAALYDLAVIGDRRALQQRIAALAAALPELAPFAQRVQRYTETFEIDALLALLSTPERERAETETVEG